MSGQPLGSDFLSFWSTSRLAIEGNPESAYDSGLLHAVEQSVMGMDSPFYAWLYPPVAFLVVFPVAALDYIPFDPCHLHRRVGLRRADGRDWEITGLAILWFAPLFWRPLSYIVPLPWAVGSLALALWLGARRAEVLQRGVGAGAGQLT